MNGLASIFSDESKDKFTRAHKVTEFNPKKFIDTDIDTEAIEIEAEKERKKLLKKSKRKHSKISEDSIDPIEQENEKLNDDNAVEIETTQENEIDDNIIDKSKDNRTVFAGNLSIKESNKSITKLFEEFGEIESIRLRSVPIAGTAIDENGNHNLMKRVCVNTKKFGDQKGSFNAYIVFKKEESVNASLIANNRLVNGRHIRVDNVKPTLFDPRRSVFLGNIPHYGDEEELRKYFADALPNGHDDIEGIRLVRDPQTLIGKGIGYLLLKDRDAVMEILKLNGKKYKNRFALRIQICGKRTKNSNNTKQPSVDVSNNDLSKSHTKDSANNSSQFGKFDFQQKRPKNKESFNSNAARRIEFKMRSKTSKR